MKITSKPMAQQNISRYPELGSCYSPSATIANRNEVDKCVQGYTNVYSNGASVRAVLKVPSSSSVIHKSNSSHMNWDVAVSSKWNSVPSLSRADNVG